MKILFLISSLNLGGAERVASTLCNHWASNNHEIILVTLDSIKNDFYSVNERIIRHSVNAYAPSRNIMEKLVAITRRIIRIRKVVKQYSPNVVISFMDTNNILAILSCLFTKVPVVITEHTYPPYFNHNNFLDFVRKIIYNLSTVFVTQTTIVASWAKRFLCSTEIAIIANPLDTNNLRMNISNTPMNNILAIGRLCPEKGFDRLINIFNQFHTLHPDWNLIIVGEGSERANLEAQIQKLKLNDRVILTGRVESTHLYYASSKIFVLSSRVEGFPMVLLEAMAHQLAVVSFDCACGPSDIINHMVNGILVPQDNINGMVIALQSLMRDADLRDKLAREAIKVRDKYEIGAIADQWISLFNAVAR